MRHSIREFNQTTNDFNCSITKEGVELVRSVFEEIKDHINLNSLTIFTSPYKRTIETSLCLQHLIKKTSNPHNNTNINTNINTNTNACITIDNVLREVILKEHQLCDLDPTLDMIIKDEIGDQYETFFDMYERCKVFMNKIFMNNIKNYKNDIINDIIVVTHGGLVNGFMNIVDSSHEYNFDWVDPKTYVPKYCGYFIVEINDLEMKLIKKNFHPV